jgi:hypothetical protein
MLAALVIAYYTLCRYYTVSSCSSSVSTCVAKLSTPGSSCDNADMYLH